MKAEAITWSISYNNQSRVPKKKNQYVGATSTRLIIAREGGKKEYKRAISNYGNFLSFGASLCVYLDGTWARPKSQILPNCSNTGQMQHLCLQKKKKKRSPSSSSSNIHHRSRGGRCVALVRHSEGRVFLDRYRGLLLSSFTCLLVQGTRHTNLCVFATTIM